MSDERRLRFLYFITRCKRVNIGNILTLHKLPDAIILLFPADFRYVLTPIFLITPDYSPT